MKRMYATPAQVRSGDVVRQTLQSMNSSRPEFVAPLIYKPASGGSLGFGL